MQLSPKSRVEPTSTELVPVGDYITVMVGGTMPRRRYRLTRVRTSRVGQLSRDHVSNGLH